jgi:hypothetical protein
MPNEKKNQPKGWFFPAKDTAVFPENLKKRVTAP